MVSRVLYLKWLFPFILLLGLVGCGDELPPYQPQYSQTPINQITKTYIIGVHPLHNPSKLYEVFNPLADYLTQHISNAQFRIQASKDYPSYDQKIAKESLDFLLPNPYQTLNAIKKRYKVINQMGSNDLFKGIILVRKDQNITDINQLKGKSIAYPAPTALAATMMPQYYLVTHGLDIQNDTKTLYVGSQESSILNVYTGQTIASATWPVPWLELEKQQPEIANQLEIFAETDTLPNNSFMYHTVTVPAELALRVQHLLANLDQTPEGEALLERMNLQKIYQANNETYAPVADFIEKFRKTLGDNSLLDKTSRD
ncbi:phosphate/phosphite/phosphonate ABC transporter substrate-binding protein [Thiosulfativibrio zosterae]|uniref:Phosphonate ABC transporter substrate-binding protein n=1 Tax=Thiosulfativibrio zosterae TaxID=2675053 RepID=A0A6F8PJQ9_9GAMM|nr:PhnD/SsuA/transferrin family substrate-binding protein [Thiosulfativibrio zosterae]BBP42308.1 hypothetical protein THMIRHAT_00540 [Thiosulfativibrio zosterae]